MYLLWGFYISSTKFCVQLSKQTPRLICLVYIASSVYICRASTFLTLSVSLAQSQLPLEGSGTGKGWEEGREGMDFRTGIWLSWLQKSGHFTDSVALFYFILLWSLKTQKLLEEYSCSICLFWRATEPHHFLWLRLELWQWKDFLPVINRKA